MAARIPVTILTGYLGAGKTSLLNRILSQDHGRRYAVIVNEFGEIGIDGDLIIGGDEELFEMNNGCVCCTVRGDLIRTLHALLNRPTSMGVSGDPSAAAFDAILIETTGLADPGPVAQTFFVDAFLLARTRLDSITTLVDARHIEARLTDSREAVEQVAFADLIVLNKTDLVDETGLQTIEARLRGLNPLAAIHRALRADIDPARVLDRGAFDLERIVELEPQFLQVAAAQGHLGHGEPGHVHDEACDHRDANAVQDHRHDDDIRSICLSHSQPMDARKVSDWLKDVLAAQGARILRTKGIIHVHAESRRLVVQAVHHLLEGDFQGAWPPAVTPHTRLVFIGRQLDGAALRAGLDGCTAGR